MEKGQGKGTDTLQTDNVFTRKEYIEREAAYRFAQDQLKKETGAYSRGWNHAMNVMKSALHNNDAIPAADVRPVVRGKWLNLWVDDDELIGGGYNVPQCSACKEDNYGTTPYCPFCGAMMEES